MKKLIKSALAVLLSAVLLISAVPITASAAGGLTLNVNASGFGATVHYDSDELEANDNFVTVEVDVNCDRDLLNTEWTLTYDGDLLEYSDSYNMKNGRLGIMPNTPGAMINTNLTSVEYGIKGTYSDLGLAPLSDDGDPVALIVVTFKALGKGVANVDIDFSSLKVSRLGEDGLADENEDFIVFSDGELRADADIDVENNISLGKAWDDSAEPFEGLHITAESNYFATGEAFCTNLEQDENGDSFVTVKYLLNAPGLYLVNCEINALAYDPEVLEWDADYNRTAGGALNFFPVVVEQGLGSGTVNMPDGAGRIVGNFSSVDPAAYAYGENGEPVTVVQARFRVLDADAGDTTIGCNVRSLSFCDEDIEQPYAQYPVIYRDTVSESYIGSADPFTVIDYTEAEPVQETTVVPTVEPTEPATEAEPTEPATEPMDETIAPFTEPATEAEPTEPATVAEPTEPATEAEPTEPVTIAEPTIEPTEDSTMDPEPFESVIVAGYPAELFGTTWDPENTNNKMGWYGGYYGYAASYYTSARENISLKVVVNGLDWYGDEYGNNINFDVTAPSYFYVYFDPETGGVEVQGDYVRVRTDFDYSEVYAVGNGEGDTTSSQGNRNVR